MPIHYIHMEHGRAAPFHRADAVSQAGEVRSEDGRSNFYGIVHNFSAAILPDWCFCSHRALSNENHSAQDPKFLLRHNHLDG
jgi:hypothetical protein